MAQACSPSGMVMPSQAPREPIDLLVAAIRVLKAVQTIKLKQLPMPVKDITCFQAFLHALMAEETLQSMTEQRHGIGVHTLLIAANHFFGVLRHADPATSVFVTSPEYLKEILDALNSVVIMQLSTYPHVDIAGIEATVMSYTDYVAHVQTDIIHDHFMRRLNHQLPEARLFNEPSVEAFWIERTKGRHSVDWDVAFGMTYNVLEESQQRLAREIIEFPSLKKALMEQMADAEHNVTVATLSAYINGSAAFEYPAAFVDTVTELHGRRPLPDPPLQALVAGLSLTNPGKLVVMAADKGMTLQGLAEMEAKDREAVCTAALGLQLPELQVFTTAIANYKSDAQYRGDVDDKAAELTKGQEHEQVLKVQERRAYELRALETVKTWLGIPCCVHRPGVVKEIASSKCPRALFTLLPYIQRVNEYTKESTVIAHFCKRYVLAEAKAQMTPHDKTAAIFVMELDGEVQNEQQMLTLPPACEACGVLASAALTLYYYCLAKLRTELTRDVANNLHIVVCLLTVAQHIDPQYPQVRAKHAEATLVRTEVLRCLQENVPFFVMPDLSEAQATVAAAAPEQALEGSAAAAADVPAPGDEALIGTHAELTAEASEDGAVHVAAVDDVDTTQEVHTEAAAADAGANSPTNAIDETFDVAEGAAAANA